MCTRPSPALSVQLGPENDAVLSLIVNTYRRAALHKWKSANGPLATYEALLKIFVDAGENNCAEVLCKVLGAGMDVCMMSVSVHAYGGPCGVVVKTFMDVVTCCISKCVCTWAVCLCMPIILESMTLL